MNNFVFSVSIIQKDTSKQYESPCKHTSKLEQRQNVSLTPSIIFHIYIKLLEEWSSKFFFCSYAGRLDWSVFLLSLGKSLRQYYFVYHNTSQVLPQLLFSAQ